MNDIDWQKVETEYVTTKKSYRMLAKEFGVSYHAVQNRGTPGMWPQKRAEYQADVVSLGIQKTAEKISEDQSELAASLSRSALRFAEIVNEHLMDPARPKPIDLLRLAQVWQILYDSLQKNEEVDEDLAGGIVVMSAREEGDDG